MKNNITVFNAGLAKKLIKMGYVVRDIKPNKENPLKTVFFFDASEEIKKIIKDYKIRKKETKERNEGGMFIEGKRDNPENKWFIYIISAKMA